MAKQKKKGHVAIPFLLALLLGIMVIGGIAMLLFRQLDRNNVPILQWQENVKKPTAADDMTILFVLDEETDGCQTTFLLTRLLPARKQVVFIGIPANMLTVMDGRQDTLEGFYRSGGIQSVETALKNETSITVDRYVILGSEGFQKICNIFGGVNYLVPNGVIGLPADAQAQYLGPAQIEKLITNLAYRDSKEFTHGESERSDVAADVMTEMLNQTDYERILDRLESNFNAVINLSETDISSADYAEHENALKYMLNYGDKIASFRIAIPMEGADGETFVLSSDFYSTVADLFEDTAETYAGSTAASE